VVYAKAASADASGTEALAAHVEPEGVPRRVRDDGSEDGGELAALRMVAGSRPLRRRGRGRGGVLRQERGMVSRRRRRLSQQISGERTVVSGGKGGGRFGGVRGGHGTRAPHITRGGEGRAGAGHGVPMWTPMLHPYRVVCVYRGY
jgi:hypothetical protein